MATTVRVLMSKQSATGRRLLAHLVETLLNTYLQMDEQHRTVLPELHGRCLELQLTTLGLTMFFCFQEQRVTVTDRYDGEVDARVRGSVKALVNAAHSSDLSESIEISGDVELTHVVRQLITSVNIDWEELLAQRVGDIPAHQLGRMLRHLGAWCVRSENNLRMDVTEYLQEEIRVLPTAIETEYFMDQVDRFSSDVERVEARVQRLVILR